MQYCPVFFLQYWTISLSCHHIAKIFPQYELNIFLYYCIFFNISEILWKNWRTMKKLKNIAEHSSNIASASIIPHRNCSNIVNYCHNISKYCYIIAVILLNRTTVFHGYWHGIAETLKKYCRNFTPILCLHHELRIKIVATFTIIARTFRNIAIILLNGTIIFRMPVNNIVEILIECCITLSRIVWNIVTILH